MSVRYFEILRDSSHKGNCIPSGRQLPRTPPLADVKRHLDFCTDDPSEDPEEPQRNTEAATRDQDNNDHDRTFDFNTQETKTENISEPIHPASMLKGMKGYQLTPADLEFIRNMKEEKLIKKLQGDLEEVQRLLKKETMALEMACTSREKAQAELNKFPSREELSEWVAAVLQRTSPSPELTGLDTKSLLAMVTTESVQRAMDEKRLRLAQMEKMMANKRKKEAEERGQFEQQIAIEQMNIQRLMIELSDLTSELAQEEEAYKALRMQIKTREEIKAEAEVEDSSEDPQAAKSQVKHQGKGRKKTVKSTEKLQDTTKQSKSTKIKHTDGKTAGQASVEDDHANKKTSETLKTSTTKQTKQKSESVTEKPTKSLKVAKGPQQKVEEQGSNSEESVRGSRKPPGTAQTAAPRPQNQTEARSGAARSTSRRATLSHGGRGEATVAAVGAREEAQGAGLRRSKRIASRS